METQKRSADSSPLAIDKVVMAARKKFSAGPRLPGAPVALDSDAGARYIFGAFGEFVSLNHFACIIVNTNHGMV
jgi:hypothetical protein